MLEFRYKRTKKLSKQRTRQARSAKENQKHMMNSTIFSAEGINV